jgi:hypothetical protein
VFVSALEIRESDVDGNRYDSRNCSRDSQMTTIHEREISLDYLDSSNVSDIPIVHWVHWGSKQKRLIGTYDNANDSFTSSHILTKRSYATVAMMPPNSG